jgi:hypothetical protein
MFNLFRKPQPQAKPQEYTQVGNQLALAGQGAVTQTGITYSGAFKSRPWKEIDAEERLRVYAVATGDIRPVGNWSETIQYRDCSKRYQSGGETYLLLKEMQIGKALYAGDFSQISVGYYSEYVTLGHGPGDYCTYCGTWNGEYGEQRLGYDCCFCGSN